MFLKPLNTKHPSIRFKYEICTPCLSRARNLCCKEKITKTTFLSQQKKLTFNTFFKFNFKIKYIIYLMKYISRSIQYAGKVEKAFNLRLNNHRKDRKKPGSVIA